MTRNEFFGSKLNTVILLVLMVLVVIALFMIQNNRPVVIKDPVPVNNVPPVENAPSSNIFGNKDDLVSFSISPGQKVSGVIKVTGSVKNAYFFEGNIILNILDMNGKLLKNGHGTATTEWTTSLPVAFSATLDFTTLPKGPAYIQIHNDNASGLAENDKSILVPIMIQ